MGSKTTTEFKVGDKVKVIKSTDFPDMIGLVCEVTESRQRFSTFACRIKHSSKGWNSLMYDWEIKKVYPPEKGHQLLFLFME